MMINSITAENFQGARSVNIRTNKHVLLIAGDNFAGKSSIRDAVAMVLGGTLTRVSLKKDSGSLVTEGAKAAALRVTDADGDEYSVTITAAGKVTDSQAGKGVDPSMPYVLDAQRFAKLPVEERRAFLFGLRNVRIEPAEIGKRLIARLFKEAPTPTERARIDAIAPLLRGGFESAAKEAARLATEAKGSWRAITGEAYGSVKAASWRAPVPAYNGAALAQAQTRLTAMAGELATKQQAVGAFAARLQDYERAVSGLPTQLETAALLVRRQAKLARDTDGLKQAQSELEGAQAQAAGSVRVGMVHALARTLSDLLAAWTEELSPGENEAVDAANAAIEGYEEEHGPIRPLSAAGVSPQRILELTQARDLMQSAVNNATRDVDASRRAQAEAQRLTDLEKPAELGLDELRTELAALQAEHDAASAVVAEQTKARDLAKAAGERTEKAALHHADVAGYASIADALGPDGIPADLLAEALGPLNDRLAQSALDSGWPQVRIEGDMRITAGKRIYTLLSESEQWRTDAMVAEAVAHLSGLRLLLLDRMDLLQPSARPQLIQWLDILAANGEIDTAIVFATLKAEPTGMPESVDTAWVQNGQCGEALADLGVAMAEA